MVDMGASLKEMKMMKMGQFDKLHEALYISFHQQRELNLPVTRPVFVEKAKLLLPMLYPNAEKPFSASTGFLWRFCKRHGLKSLGVQNENVAATIFQGDFTSLMEGYELDQIFNCDETRFGSSI